MMRGGSTLGRIDRFPIYYMSNLLPIREWRCQDINQVLLHGDHFFLSSELLDKNVSIQSKLPTAACWSREITEENLKQTCFMSKAKAKAKAKANSVPQLGNHSSHVGAFD